MTISAIPWINDNEDVVAANHPTKTDVTNRPLRALITACGLDPDLPFYGLVARKGTVVVDVSAFEGASAADKAIAALQSVDATGHFTGLNVVVDFRSLSGVQLLDKNIRNVAINGYYSTRMTWLWGSAEYRMTTFQHYGANDTHRADGAYFVKKDMSGARVTGSSGWAPATQTCLSAITSGSAVITPASGAAALVQTYAKVGSVVGVFGQKMSTNGSSDQVALTVDPGSGGTTLTVGSTAGFPSTGYLRTSDNSELIRYTGTTGTTFTGCVRGYGGTTAAAHAIGVVLERCTYDAFYITAINSSTGAWTLDRTLDLTATALDTIIGPHDVSWAGHAVLDGNLDPATDDTANPFGIFLYLTRNATVGKHWTFQNWDHGGIMLQMAIECHVEGTFRGNSRPSLSLGSQVWLFCRVYRSTVRGIFVDGYQCVHIDDRTTSPSLVDGASVDNTIEILSAINQVRVVDVSSCHRNVIIVRSMQGYTVAGVVLERSAQSTSNVDPQNNTVQIDAFVRGAGSPPEINFTGTTDTSGNRILCTQPGVTLSGTRAGLHILGPRGMRVQGNLGTSFAFDTSLGDYYTGNMNGASFQFLFPTGGWFSREFTVELTNTSGGAITPTVTASFKTAGALPAIANGAKRIFTFYNNGANWIEKYRSPADIT